MDLSNVFILVGFGLTFFSTMVITGLAVGSSRKKKFIFEPNVKLPESIQALIVNGPKQTVGPVPWPCSKSRTNFKCKTIECSTTKKIYDIKLYKLVDVADDGPDGPSGSATESSAPWSKYINAWYLGYSLMSTGFISDYPVATVIEIPSDTPTNVKFVLDGGLLQDGLRPSIDSNGTLFDGPNGLNVTGDWPNSFVIVNNAGHTVYFGKQALDLQPNGPIEYWAIGPNQQVLMWPQNKYWYSINNAITRYWNASLLPADSSVDFCAYLAENIMYNYLAPQSPEIQS